MEEEIQEMLTAVDHLLKNIEEQSSLKDKEAQKEATTTTRETIETSTSNVVKWGKSEIEDEEESEVTEKQEEEPKKKQTNKKEGKVKDTKKKKPQPRPEKQKKVKFVEPEEAATEERPKKRARSARDYVVESIIGIRLMEPNKKINKGSAVDWEYLVKWKGYSVDKSTWEPKSHLHNCDGLIQSFKDLLLQSQPDE